MHSTIFACRTDRQHLLRALLLLLAGTLAGCGTKEVQVEGEFPDPLPTPLPITLGVWYPEDFRNHEFFDEATSRTESEWLVRTGEAQVKMWDKVLNGMFAELVYVELADGIDPENPPDVDAVLIPRVDELQYSIPAHTNVKVYEIWMRYHFELLQPDGNPIADWTMTSYGKTPTAFMRSDQAAVNLAAIVALRDAGANFATSFRQVPAVGSWLDNQTREEPREAPR